MFSYTPSVYLERLLFILRVNDKRDLCSNHVKSRDTDPGTVDSRNIKGLKNLKTNIYLYVVCMKNALNHFFKIVVQSQDDEIL
ncbi:LOW QUALITY PROTEIN: uncharacterized protein T551_00948 [Pneumocystis jirovecii RU7]|uniref:Uncharacterized protein n=1 Tax=Pneumocystis jirovecii (strain RU7) TaxID=1408657 RepID=A0A0W4ZTI4_PNEJ7|nr:LOW QUALITY PROTEIN: uncharacterized protein T551_00948 [Pneumocystis jirovecii RU7]KTW31687.1 LOW QUALITY PROTEIN: hypothetical protein T551_00948 [Pneumocystis jirovecii RU7]